MRTEERDRRSGRDGFSLIELLIVMVVIGILASIVVPRLDVTRHKAYRTTLVSDLKSFATAQELYFADHYRYASDVTALEAAESQGVTLSLNSADNSGWAATAIHVGMDGEQCGVFHGDASAAGGSPASEAGAVGCTF